MADIFLSYAHEDEGRIRDLVHALEQHGWSIFWDRRIPAGKTWQEYIGQALSAAKCVMVAWSQHSITSKWVIEEANDAEERGLLVPVLLDPVKPPLGLRGIQAANLTDWKLGFPSPRFDQLIQDIAGVEGMEPHPPASGEEMTQPLATPSPVRTEPPPREPTPPQPEAQKARAEESGAIKPEPSQAEKKRGILGTPFVESMGMVALFMAIAVGIILWSQQGPRPPQTRAVESEAPAVTTPPVTTLPVQSAPPQTRAVETPAAEAPPETTAPTQPRPAETKPVDTSIAKAPEAAPGKVPKPKVSRPKSAAVQPRPVTKAPAERTSEEAERMPSLAVPRAGSTMSQLYVQSWLFRWDKPRTPSRVQQYHLMVTHGNDTHPLVDVKINGTEYTVPKACATVASVPPLAWRWQVRAQFQDGTWGPWAGPSTFNVESFDKDHLCQQCPQVPACQRR
jgi:hypothetical protein